MRSDDRAFGVYWSGHHASSLLVPYVIDAFQFVRIDPWFDDFFVLPLFRACDGDCSYEHTFREYDDVFVVACALVVVWSSGQRVSSAVGFSGNVTYLEIEFH